MALSTAFEHDEQDIPVTYITHLIQIKQTNYDKYLNRACLYGSFDAVEQDKQDITVST